MGTYTIIDTHTHLCDPVFNGDREAVLERARAVGVTAVVTVSENLKDGQRNLELASRFPALHPAAGLYPSCLDMAEAEEMAALIRRERGRFVAIGEVGLDFWVVKEDRDKAIQQEIFGLFIDLAQELDLPLNVHSRSAGRHAVAMLLTRGASRVQLHAFDGKAASAMPAVEAGYFFSIPPSTVRSPQKQKLVKRLPLESLLVETDSPVLGPTREERNEPANIVVAVDAVSELKGLSRDAVLEAVLQNTRRLYGERIMKRCTADLEVLEKA